MRLFLLVLGFSLSFLVLQDSKADTELNNPYVNNYPFKSVIIQYKNEARFGHKGDEDAKTYSGSEELFIKGDKSLRITTKERPDEDGEKETIKGMKLVTPEKEFVIDIDEKEAIEIENPKKYGKAKYEELTEKEKIEFYERMEKRKVVSMDLLGVGRKVGTETVLGKTCDVYESGQKPSDEDYMNKLIEGAAPPGYSKIWIWRDAGIPLKMIAEDIGSYSETVATGIEENVDIPDSKFELPEGTEVFFDEKASESAKNETLSRFELYKYGVRQDLRFKAGPKEVLDSEGNWVPADSPEGKKILEEAEAKRKAKIGATPAPETTN
ncbi:MAG TPA: hypothetical protein PKC29_00775 [Thermodesulfobacteriota bacterium]|nr:hypothetical protein [Thermodesulfobacteriota bacterium]